MKICQLIKNNSDFLFFVVFIYTVNAFSAYNQYLSLNQEIDELHQFLIDQSIEQDEINNLLLYRAENLSEWSGSEYQMSLGLTSSARGFAYLHDGEEEEVKFEDRAEGTFVSSRDE